VFLVGDMSLSIYAFLPDGVIFLLL
jgi:hypothetical protein